MDEDLQLDALRVFTALADSGSIAGAAAALETSRPRIRRQLDQLEDTLKTVLFARSWEGVELTPEGADLLPRARQLLADARLLLTQAWSQRAVPIGRLRVGIQVGFEARNAIALGRLVAAQFPDARVEYVIAERPVDLLPDRVDFVICLGEQSASVPCLEMRLARIDQVLLASPAWLEKNGTPGTIDEAVEHLEAIWRGPDDRGRHLHLRDGTTRPIEAPIITPDESFLRALAAQDAGLVYAPPGDRFSAPGEPLVPVLADQVGRPVIARLVVPEVLAEMPMMATLLRMLRAFLKHRDES